MANLKKYGLLVLSILGAISGYILTNSVKFGICIANETIVEASCINAYERIGNALLNGMGGLAVVFVLLLLVPKAWGAWKKFAVWFVPLAVLIFIFYKDPGSGNLVSPYAETVFLWVAILYVGISAGIIGALALKKK